MRGRIVTQVVLNDVSHERVHQELRKRLGRFKFTCADADGLTNPEKCAILGEEFGEVCREALTQPDRRLATDSTGSLEALYNELVQVAAVAVAWAEAVYESRQNAA